MAGESPGDWCNYWTIDKVCFDMSIELNLMGLTNLVFQHFMLLLLIISEVLISFSVRFVTR